MKRLALLGIALVGLGESLFGPVVPTLLGQMAKDSAAQAAEAFALDSAIHNAGTMFAPITLGLLYGYESNATDASNSSHGATAFASCSCVAAVAAMIIWCFRRG